MSHLQSCRPRPSHRTPERGQSLAIFAVMSLFLFAVVGLAVDGGYAYYVSDQLERGAVAAALAGVPVMPNLITGGTNATTTATKAATYNGWVVNGPRNGGIAVTAVIDPSTGQPYNNRLQVELWADAPVFFLNLLGFGSHRESRTAVAEFLPPITFGQPGNQLGSDLTNIGSGTNNYYFMRSEGWGTDRVQGDPYGPNPLDWGGVTAANPADTHLLSGTAEPLSQPTGGLPARGGQSYQIFVPAGQKTTLQVYNPAFAPDNGAVNAQGFTYHEDDGDFPEPNTAGCARGGATEPGTAPCTPVGSTTDATMWPTMSYTVYKSPNPFDHTQDQWQSNLTVQSIDASANATATCQPSNTCTYTVPGVATTPAAQPLSQLSGMYHSWMDITAVPTGAPYSQLASVMYPGANTRPLQFSGGSVAPGLNYRLRVDQLDNLTGDPAANGRSRAQNSQAHKGYAVRAASTSTTSNTCTGCTVSALNDMTVFTPVTANQFSIPLVSIPPDYAGRTFSLYIYDPGDVSGASNVLKLLQPTTSGTSTTVADTTDGIYAGGSSQFDTNTPYRNMVAGGAGAASIDALPGGRSVYNGKWLKFDISVPSDYASSDITSDPATWFWSLQYNTNGRAADTISVNLGFDGSPVHIVSG